MPRRAPEPCRVSASLSRSHTVSSGVLARPTSAELPKSNLVENVIRSDGSGAERPQRPSTPSNSMEVQVRDLERRLQEQNHLYWESAKRKEEDLHVAKSEAAKLQQQLQELSQKHHQSHGTLALANSELQKMVHAEAALRSEYTQFKSDEVNCVASLRQQIQDESDGHQLELRELRGQHECSAKRLHEVQSELLQQRDALAAEKQATAKTHDTVAALREELAASEEKLVVSKNEVLELRQACFSSREEVSELRTVSGRFQEDFSELGEALSQKSQEVSKLQSALRTANAATVEAKELFQRNEEQTRKQLASEAQCAREHEKRLQKYTDELCSCSNELNAANQKVKDQQQQEQHLQKQLSSSSEAHQRLKKEMNDLVRQSSVDASDLRLRADQAESCLQECEVEHAKHRDIFSMEVAKEKQRASQECAVASEESRLAAAMSSQLERMKAEIHEVEMQHAKEAGKDGEFQEQLRQRDSELCDAIASAINAEQAAEAGQEKLRQRDSELSDAIHSAKKEEAEAAKAASAAQAASAECEKLRAELNQHLHCHEEALAQKDADLRELRSHARKQLEKVRVSTEEWAAQEVRREHDLEVANQNASKAHRKIEELRNELTEARSKFQRHQSNEKELRQARELADHCARLTHSLEAQLEESHDKLKRAELRQEAKGEELETLKARSAALQNQMQDLRGKLSVERLGRPRGADAGVSKGDAWLYCEPTGFFAPGACGPAPCEALNDGKPGGPAPPARRSHSVGQLPRPPMPVPGSQCAVLPPAGGPSMRMGWATNAARNGSSRDPSPRNSRPSKVEKMYCK